MTTFLSDEELLAIQEEVSRTPSTVSEFTFSLEQAKLLVKEVLVRRGAYETQGNNVGIQQIDLFDTNYIINQ